MNDHWRLKVVAKPLELQ